MDSTGGETGEEMIREGSARHVLDDGSATLVIWVMDRPGQEEGSANFLVISQLFFHSFLEQAWACSKE